MSQQINLYQPIFRTTRKVFSAFTIAQTAGVFIVGLLLIYGYASWHVAGLGEDIAALDAQRTTAMAQLQTLSAQSTPAPRSQLVEDQLREAEIEVAQKERLLVAFQTRRFGETRGFSRHFTALARERLDGLWLTHVIIRDGGIALAGAAEAGELVPRYLARIGRDAAFTGTEFPYLQLTRGDEPSAPVEFSVTTTAEGAE